MITECQAHLNREKPSDGKSRGFLGKQIAPVLGGITYLNVDI